MTKDECIAVVKNQIELMNDNAGNRITVAVATGICFLHEQFVNTLVVTEKPGEKVADQKKVKKE